MKVSQLIHAMDRDDDIIIDKADERIDKMTIYNGTVRGIKKDNPINKMHVQHVFACDNVMVVLAVEQRGAFSCAHEKGGEADA